MKTLLLLLTLALSTSTAFSTIHNVEVGGNAQTAPYYAPQFITIEVGDTVLWTFVSGTHNVTSTSGPASFASGDLGPNNTFQFVFTIAGFYEYECTRFNHAATQFGTITVEDPLVGIDEPLFAGFTLSPNPVSNLLRVQTTDLSDLLTIQVYEVGSGKMVREIQSVETNFELSVADLPRGRYLLMIRDESRKMAKIFIRE